MREGEVWDWETVRKKWRDVTSEYNFYKAAVTATGNSFSRGNQDERGRGVGLGEG